MTGSSTQGFKTVLAPYRTWRKPERRVLALDATHPYLTGMNGS